MFDRASAGILTQGDRICKPILGNKKTSSVGSGLLSQGPASQLPSALEGLTTRFGMGLGVPPPLEPPTELVFFTC